MDFVRRIRKKTSKKKVRSLEQLYKFNVKLYDDPPTKDVELLWLEHSVVERLKVLHILEQIGGKRINNDCCEDWRKRVLIEMKLQKLAGFVNLIELNPNEDPESLLLAREMDYISHFVMRLYFCESDVLRQWFVDREIEFFRLKFHSLSLEEKQNFLEENHLSYRLQNFPELTSETHENDSQNTQFFKVKFTEVLTLVSERKCNMKSGFAYVTDLSSIIETIQRNIIEKGLMATHRMLNKIREDLRIKDLMKTIHNSRPGQDLESMDETLNFIESADFLSTQYFPLCARICHETLREKHHLKYFGRNQYQLFLKGIGVSLQESLNLIERVMKFFGYCQTIRSDHFSYIKFQYNHPNHGFFIVIIQRHIGICSCPPYPTDPYRDESHWPEGFGQLTNEGKRQMYRLGQYLRRRYVNLIDRKYSNKDIYVQSTDFDRTIMSAQACLAGLYPPTDEEKFDDDIMWQPIPVHTVPSHLDYVLSTGRTCPSFEAAHLRFRQTSPEIRRVLTEHASLIAHWARYSGLIILSIDIVSVLYNTLSIEKEQNKPLPEWAERAIQCDSPMKYMAALHFQSYTGNRLLARLKQGHLIKEIMQRFEQKINSFLRPDRKLWLYAAHDLTIVNVLNSLKLFELHLPPYAASVHFELYKTSQNEYYIQIFYRSLEEEYPQPLNIPECGVKCTIRQFYDLYHDIIPGDFDTECRIDYVHFS
ncbi:Lysosomal acid phosphatase [Pseudolycoriella hygida]|uniref:Lysosomal acid phosphatase n=1 Tax=Pseudolycoriella hygida TaxID=35572 RepID=A0A9Q0NCF5_9DIPT|nr:Lysosomal acid phosphatase [Pseudolycoriella hygida]